MLHVENRETLEEKEKNRKEKKKEYAKGCLGCGMSLSFCKRMSLTYMCYIRTVNPEQRHLR